MQSPDWVTLVTDLTQHGFCDLLFVEIFCPQDGDWRGAVTGLSENILPCPKCEQPAEVAILGRGLTKTPDIEWKCVSPPLRAGDKTHREDAPTVPIRSDSGRRRCSKFYDRARRELAEAPALETRVFEDPAPKARTPRATRAEMQQRIRLIAEMMIRGESQREIAQKVSRNWDDFRVLLCRRRPSIEAEVVRLRASVLHEPFDRERRFVCS